MCTEEEVFDYAIKQREIIMAYNFKSSEEAIAFGKIAIHKDIKDMTEEIKELKKTLESINAEISNIFQKFDKIYDISTSIGFLTEAIYSSLEDN